MNTESVVKGVENPRVYITNFSGYPYEKAKDYAEELVYMTNGYLDLNELETIKSKINEFINRVNPSDYLILSGNNCVAAIAAHLWIKKLGFCNILHWNNSTKSYIHYILN